jgi:2-polyprenyl-3-methyl-5-hydroxy-6-metoxy-1,4-benzoquinol methylase
MMNDSKFKDPLSLVKQQYSRPETIKSYSTDALFPSEKILIEKYVRPTSTILEIGCGAGRISIALAKMGYKVTGIDFIPEMIEAAKGQARYQKVIADFKVMDALEMTFPDESFQYVLFNGIDQIPGEKNRRKILRDIFKLLESGGIFILTTRSGLAFGRRWLAWVWISLVYLLKQLKHSDASKYEFGDKVWKNRYNHYFNPFRFRNMLRNIGFKELYFNSHKNIISGREPGFLTNFSNDSRISYVLKK